MQTDQIQKLRANWKAKGNPACEHPLFEQEHIGSGGTGDYYCVVCGIDRDNVKNDP